MLKKELELKEKVNLLGEDPDFQGKFRNIKNTVLREIDPQWIAENEPAS